MTTIVKFAGAALLIASVSGCATKGYVNRQVQAAADTSRAGWTASDDALRSELSGQISTLRTDVDGVKRDVSALQRDLGVLRDSLGARIIAMEGGMQFVFPVRFAFDDATVRPTDQAALDRFVQVVNRHYSGSIVTIEGFADPAGSAAYNRRLSQERADNVRAYMEQAGIQGVTLRTVGMGETRPVVDGASRDDPGAEANRRVVFVIEGVPENTGN